MRLFAPLALLALACLSSGCLNFEPKADTTRFFVLSAARPELATNRTVVARGPVVTRVFLPDYLLRRSLAVRKSPNEVIFADSFQWAEPLDRGLARVLTENLSEWVPENSDLSEIQLTVQRFDVSLEGEVALETDWVRVAGGKVHSSRTTVSGPSPSTDPVGAVQTMSQALARLAQEIAEAEGLKAAP